MVISHFADFSPNFTLSVASEIFTKSVMKIMISIAEEVIINLPSKRKAKTMKQVLAIVLAILFKIQILMRSNIILPTLIGATIPARPSFVEIKLTAPYATLVSLFIAMPTSACFSAGASFTPSLVIPTI